MAAPIVYFLSDAHIGCRAIEDGKAHSKRLVDALTQMSKDADAIYLLGDIFDFWCEYVWTDKSKKEFEPVLDCLRGLCDKGIEVHYFVGNHDMWTFGELAKKTGVKVHYKPEQIEIGGKKVFVGHGDGVVPSNLEALYSKKMMRKIRQFIWLRKVFRNRFLQYLFRLMPPIWGNEIGYEWSRKSRMKELAHPHPYAGEERETLVLYAKEQEKKDCHNDMYVFGHRHIELHLQIARNSEIVILGDFFRQWTYARMAEGGKICLCNWEE